MVTGILTKRGKVVYRSHRNKRDRVKKNFRLSDVLRIWRDVYEDYDATYFDNPSQQLHNYEELEKLFLIEEYSAELLSLVYIGAGPVLKLRMSMRLFESSISRLLGISIERREGEENGGTKEKG